jgi:hypothetical protein
MLTIIIEILKFCTDLTQKSASMVVMTAFAVHFLKEVSRSQLQSAARKLLTKEEKNRLQPLEKSEFILPLAKAFIMKKVVEIKKGADQQALSRDDLKKISPF